MVTNPKRDYLSIKSCARRAYTMARRWREAQTIEERDEIIKELNGVAPKMRALYLAIEIYKLLPPDLARWFTEAVEKSSRRKAYAKKNKK